MCYCSLWIVHRLLDTGQQTLGKLEIALLSSVGLGVLCVHQSPLSHLSTLCFVTSPVASLNALIDNRQNNVLRKVHQK